MLGYLLCRYSHSATQDLPIRFQVIRKGKLKDERGVVPLQRFVIEDAERGYVLVSLRYEEGRAVVGIPDVTGARYFFAPYDNVQEHAPRVVLGKEGTHIDFDF